MNSYLFSEDLEACLLEDVISKRGLNRVEKLTEGLKGYFFFSEDTEVSEILRAKKSGLTACLISEEPVAEKIALAERVVTNAAISNHRHVVPFRPLVDLSVIPLREKKRVFSGEVKRIKETPSSEAREILLASLQASDLVIAPADLQEDLKLTGVPQLGLQGLPEEWAWLSETGEETIARVSENYPGVEKFFQELRQLALEELNSRVDKLLMDLQSAHAPVPLAWPEDYGVVILNEGFSGRARITLDSLESLGVPQESIALIAALPCRDRGVSELSDEHADFFDIYQSLEEAIKGSKKKYLYLLRAGVQVSPGFLRKETNQVELFKVYPSDDYPLKSFPRNKVEAFVQPIVPQAMFFPRSSRAVKGVAAMGPLAPWGILLAMLGESELCVVDEPFFTAKSHLLRENPVDCYRAFIAVKEPELLVDIPPSEEEWPKLLHTLLGIAYERESSTVKKLAPFILPKAAQARPAEKSFDEEAIQTENILLREAFAQSAKENYQLRKELSALQGKYEALSHS